MQQGLDLSTAVLVEAELCRAASGISHTLVGKWGLIFLRREKWGS